MAIVIMRLLAILPTPQTPLHPNYDLAGPPAGPDADSDAASDAGSDGASDVA